MERVERRRVAQAELARDRAHIHPRAHWRPGIDLPYFLGIWPMLKLGVFRGPNIMHKAKLAVHGFDPKTGERIDPKKTY